MAQEEEVNIKTEPLTLWDRLCWTTSSVSSSPPPPRAGRLLHPPVPFYPSPVGTASQSGRARPSLCCTG
ncbi:hypothetical protein EYF80_051353 [Liparis tanakae]|uniref:Uncharacterized protein n=1 Tax=Liparis tanakae TaxID=230148 RepID=A0A4Z2FC50_9TELE|nr:hypothetical protein EYF80_051353 [Liparis tanakae]